jgi:MoaA/NifB/PqqE/SkfB family radical SAM enzyme
MNYKSDFEKADRISEAEDFPEVVLIDNCNACNLKCSMCDHKNMERYRKIWIMEMGLYKKIVDEISVENPAARVWQIFFGEPFMCRDMAQRIQYAKQRGLSDVVLNSNGVMMTEKRSKEVIEAGLDAMYVGIDANSESIYNRIRIGGKYSRAVGNVLKYRELLEKYGNGKQELFVQFVVSDINEHEVEDFKLFWKKNGVNVKIRPKVSWAGLVDAANLQEIDELHRKSCYWLMRTINICADGKTALCSVDVHCRVPCGDVTKQSIKEIWRGKLKNYRRMQKEGKFAELPEMCRECADWQSAYADFVLAD